MRGGERQAADERTWVRRQGPLGELEADWCRHYYRHAVECFQETACFVVAFDDFRIDDGWVYVREPDEPAEDVQQRREAYNEQARAWLDKGSDHWEAVIRPEVESRLTRMRRTRPRSDALPSLVRHLEVCMEESGRILGNLHWTMVAGFVADNDGRFAELAGCRKEEVHAYVGGYTHATERLVRELRALAALQRAGDPSFDAAFARLLRRHGRRNGSGYGSATTFASPTWAMSPDLALDVIAGYARTDIEEAERRERALRRRRRDAYRRLRARVEREHGGDRAQALDRARDVIARQIRAMEDHNALMEQETQGTLRESIDRVGRALVSAGRIDDPTDVLGLTLAELRALPHGDLRELVAAREEDRRRRAENPPPPHFGPAPTGPPLDIAARADAVATEPGVLVGVGASAGVATGRAVVASDSSAPPEVHPGDVLVARDAGPAWTPVFPLLAGVVLDQGAAFQHAALVAREFGIPAVLATQHGTTTIPHGATVTVDGDAGRVRVDA